MLRGVRCVLVVAVGAGREVVAVCQGFLLLLGFEVLGRGWDVFPFHVRGLHDLGVEHEVCVGVVDAVEICAAEGGQCSVEAAAVVSQDGFKMDCGRRTLLLVHAQTAS